MSEATAKPVRQPSNEVNLSWRDQRYVKFYKVVDELVYELQEQVWMERRKRRLKGNALIKLHYSVECLLRNCMAVVLQRQRIGEASIQKGQRHYGSSRSDKLLTYSIHIERAFNGLVELGYLEITKGGYFDRVGRKDGSATSRLSRYAATKKLLCKFTDEEISAIPALIPSYQDPETIRVRVKETDENGVGRRRTLAVSETPEVLQMSTNLEVINHALSKHWYDLQIPDQELSELQRRLAADHENERTIRMDNRNLYRVFNDPELKTGGRFYGGWWQNIPREYRKHMIVNGKPMVELDYSNQHPSILYAWAGIMRPKDCYSDVIKLEKFPEGTTQRDLRDMVKAAFNAMLNSPKVLKQAPKGVRPSRFKLKWSDVSEAIMEYHKSIAHHFYTGIGLKLQRVDSDIAENVMLHFAKDGIAVLPLHDSFLMHSGYATWLEPVMRNVFQEVVGVPPTIDHKSSDERSAGERQQRDDGIGLPVTLSIKEIMERSQGHNHRLSAFQSIRYLRPNNVSLPTF